MDLRFYFNKIREISSSIPADFVSVISLETSDGGRAGVVSEVSRRDAARLIAEGRARLIQPAQPLPDDSKDTRAPEEKQGGG